jgi:signal transduction histidine kinase
VTVPRAGTAQQPKLYRSADGRMLAGVAQGLAIHLGLRPRTVRIAFIVLTFFNAFGALLYLAFWAVLPLQPATSSGTGQAETKGQKSRRLAAERGPVVAAAVLALGVILLLRGTPLFGDSMLILPLVLGGAGLALVWRQADEAQRSSWLRVSSQIGITIVGQGQSRRVALMRLGGGVVLLTAGVASFLALSGNWSAARDGLVAGIAIMAGVALITAPWWWQLIAGLSAERRERIRSQERAELAAHLHDSVLQTLALIQRHVESPREVARLARGQERELRSWLYRPQLKLEAQFAAGMEAAAAEVENAYAVQVESVVVGDADVDDKLAAVIQATREALANAAKHAGVTTVSLYAEVEQERVSVFVRDRGAGFDTDLVADDRHGVQGSIIGRMERHGGRAAIRSKPGAGTEVELTMDRSVP